MIGIEPQFWTKNILFLTLSLLGYLKTRISSKSHVWCPNMTNHWKALVLYFENLQKNLHICKKLNFLSQNPVIKQNCLQKKFFPKNEKLYIFEKPLTMPFQICQNFCKILNNLIFNQEKLKMCKFPLTGCLQKIAIFSQNLCNSFPYVIGFPKS